MDHQGKLLITEPLKPLGKLRLLRGDIGGSGAVIDDILSGFSISFI
jgi:hypothetical protein